MCYLFKRYIWIDWRLGRLLCKLAPGLQATISLVCVFSIATIAVDRWIFILNTGKNKTKKISLKKIYSTDPK